jgi:hypothetical protein
MRKTNGLDGLDMVGAGRLSAENKDLIGQVLTDEALAKVMERHGCVRHKKLGYMFTMDFIPGRLNIHTGADDVVSGFSWG